MLATLALSLLTAAAPATTPAAHTDDPPIRLKLSDDVFARGDHAKVKVKAAKDGYLVVLRSDATGRVRVLYPLDPEDSGKIRGGKELEIRGRGDREAFTVDDREGSGTVLAAISEEPFHFDSFTKNGHWDYRALTTDQKDEDVEGTLLGLVEGMTGGQYDYDLVGYTVTDRRGYRYYSGWHGPWYYNPFYPCFECGPWFGFRATIGFGHSHGFGRRWR